MTSSGILKRNMKRFTHIIKHVMLPRHWALVVVLLSMHGVVFYGYWNNIGVYTNSGSILYSLLNALSGALILLLLINMVMSAAKAGGLLGGIKKVVIWLLIGAALISSFTVLQNVYDNNPRSFPDNYPWSCDPNQIDCAVIEDHAKIDVAKMPHTQWLVQNFGSDAVTVRALAYAYISDSDYVARLLGEEYRGIHCIVFVDWPGGQHVFLEMDHHSYQYFSQQEFEELITNASTSDRELLYKNLH